MIVDINDLSCMAEVISIFLVFCFIFLCNIEVILILIFCFDNNIFSDFFDDLFQGIILIENFGNNGGWLVIYLNGG